jgi:hypothetical protein
MEYCVGLAGSGAWNMLKSIVCLALVVESCSAGPGAAAAVQAQDLCAGPGLVAARQIGGDAVTGAFAGTAVDVVAWASRGRSAALAEPLKRLPNGSFVAFCYFDGHYTDIPQPPGADLTYTRALYLVPASGDPILYEVGPASAIPVQAMDQTPP